MAVPAPSATAARAQGAGPLTVAKRGQGGGLGEHAGDDERFAAGAVGERTGDELPGAPHGGVEGGEHPDLTDAEPVGGEQHGEQAPGQAVVEVVDQAGLVDGKQVAVGERWCG